MCFGSFAAELAPIKRDFLLVKERKQTAVVIEKLRFTRANCAQRSEFFIFAFNKINIGCGCAVTSGETFRARTVKDISLSR